MRGSHTRHNLKLRFVRLMKQDKWRCANQLLFIEFARVRTNDVIYKLHILLKSDVILIILIVLRLFQLVVFKNFKA